MNAVLDCVLRTLVADEAGLPASAIASSLSGPAADGKRKKEGFLAPPTEICAQHNK